MKLTPTQLTQAAAELNDAIKNWKIIEHRGEFVVLRLPHGSNTASPSNGETMIFWRFDTRHGAERFRNVQILKEMSLLKEPEAA